MNSKLNSAAQKHADWMAQTRQYSHAGDGGKTFWTRLLAEGYQPSGAGENIAYGHRTVSDVMAEWMQSPGHRQNILNPAYKHVGYGVASHGGRLYWCVVFAAQFDGFMRSATVGIVDESLPEPLTFLKENEDASVL
jgi:uncharacterized protein YkwD